MIMAKESLERWEQSAKHRPKLKDDIPLTKLMIKVTMCLS